MFLCLFIFDPPMCVRIYIYEHLRAKLVFASMVETFNAFLLFLISSQANNGLSEIHSTE